VRRQKLAAFAAELATVPVFATLTDGQRSELAQRATRAQEPAGMLFAKEGERGDELVVILQGEVEVRHDGAVLATLGPGDIVGELALVDDAKRRTATVVARTAVVVAYVGRHDFDALAEEAPAFLDAVEATIRDRRGA
jgi:CRP/FNR family cyclic AMP-dependent transcriptional regulator